MACCRRALLGMGSEMSRQGSEAQDTAPQVRHTTVLRSAPLKTLSTSVRGSVSFAAPRRSRPMA